MRKSATVPYGITLAALPAMMAAVVAIAVAQVQTTPPPAPAIQGQRVAGKVGALPRGIPAGLIRVALRREPLMPNARFVEPAIVVADADVADDGSFLFGSVPPGKYGLKVVGFKDVFISTRESGRFDVIAGRDITNIVLNAEPVMYGRVTVEDGSSLPVEINATPGDPEAVTMARVQVRYTGYNPGRISAVRADGAFLLPQIPIAGDRDVVFLSIPNGHDLKSISYMGQDLVHAPLNAKTDAAAVREGIRVVLTKNSSPVFTVSGRVVSSSVQRRAARSAVRLWSAIEPVRVSETLLAEDGTFTFRGIAPGTYSVRWQNSSQASVEVTARDVAGVELTYSGDQASTTLARSKRGVDEVFSEILIQPRLVGKSMERIIQERIGPNSVDCGKFRLLGVPLGVSTVDSIAAALDCVRSSMNQRKPFFVVTVSNGFDDSHNDGIAGDANGALYQFSSCIGACGGLSFERCPPQSAPVDIEGALACELPPTPVIRWPAPQSEKPEGGR